MVKPRTPNTKKLEPKIPNTKKLAPFEGQFFQWRFIDVESLSEVKKLFDELFQHLLRTTGDQFQASNDQWRGRQDEWNKVWRLRIGVTVSPADIPAYLASFRLWRNGKGEYLDSGATMGSVYNMHPIPPVQAESSRGPVQRIQYSSNIEAAEEFNYGFGASSFATAPDLDWLNYSAAQYPSDPETWRASSLPNPPHDPAFQSLPPETDIAILRGDLSSLTLPQSNSFMENTSVPFLGSSYLGETFTTGPNCATRSDAVMFPNPWPDATQRSRSHSRKRAQGSSFDQPLPSRFKNSSP